MAFREPEENTESLHEVLFRPRLGSGCVGKACRGGLSRTLSPMAPIRQIFPPIRIALPTAFASVLPSPPTKILVSPSLLICSSVSFGNTKSSA
jgi:hypothetical protein